MLQDDPGVAHPSDGSDQTDVFCLYEDWDNDAGSLCELWCQIQTFKGRICSNCPVEYRNRMETDLLCRLWNDLEKLQKNTTDLRPAERPQSLLTCKYNDKGIDAKDLCDLWCKIQEYDGNRCAECPEEFLDEVESDLLCKLWDELHTLQGQNIITPIPPLQIPPSSVTCIYEDRVNNKKELCNLWCDIQKFSGRKCTTCPNEYNSKVEADLLCQLWNQLDSLQDNTNSPSIFIPPVPTIPTLIFCPYSENVNDAVDLCDLFCKIQAFDGMQCTNCPKEYESKVERELLCQLWNELEALENDDNETTTIAVFSPVTCIYEDNQNDAVELCDLWCKIQSNDGNQCSQCPGEYHDKIESELLCQLWNELETLQADPSQSITSSPPHQPVPCVYQDRNDAQELCSLWCKIQHFEDKQCSNCPDTYINRAESPTLCDLWNDLELLKNNSTPLPLEPSSLVQCIYEDKGDDSLYLCDLWCQIQKYEGKECSKCPDVYRFDPEQLILCDLWEELEQLQTSPGIPAEGDGEPVDCIHEDNPTSSIHLCELWCQVQSYKDATCIECPDLYLNDSESQLLCDLYSDLKKKEYDKDKESGIDFIMQDSVENITCKYRDHLSSSENLCQVWCEIRALDGQQCVSCPDQYTQDTHHQELCDIWAQIVEAESSKEDTTTIDPPQNVACPYETLPNTSPAHCELWCELELQNGNNCCPAKYIGDSEESLLCKLHNDLEEILESDLGQVTSNPSPQPIVCDHSDNPTSSEALCELWCEIQTRTLGSECLTCPDNYTGDQEKDLLCSLWFDLEMKKYESAQDSTTLGPQTMMNVTCIHDENPTSSQPLCHLWCELQSYTGVQCVTCPDHLFTDKEAQTLCSLWEELLDLKNQPNSTIPENSMSTACPYESNNSSEKLCELWCQVKSYDGFSCCPAKYLGDIEEEKLCQLWNELQILDVVAEEYDDYYEDDPVPVDCLYEDNPTSSEDLCELWCQVQAHRDSQCIECPAKYDDEPDRDLVCSLWSELVKMEHTQEMMPGVSVTNLPPQNMTCKYSSHLSSGALCEVWCEIQELAGYQCVTCPQHYTQDPEALTLCSLWEEILKIENAGAALTVANPSPVECLYENNTSSAGPLCDLYCQLQSYNGHYCCPSQFTQDDERGLLCQLWSELEELNTANGPVTTTDFPLIPVDCIYEGNPTSSEPLCNASHRMVAQRKQELPIVERTHNLKA